MNNEITFEDGDLLAMKPFAERLESFIKVERNFVDNGLVIALNSRFGTGKTTFLNMWRNSLRQKNVARNFNPIVVSLNAWESDYFGDPLYGIVSALLESLECNNDESTANAIREAAKDIGNYSMAIANQFVNKVTGVSPIDAEKYANDKKKERTGIDILSPDAFTAFEERKKAMLELKRQIQSFIQQANDGVLFLVDELDRCRPDYAISYLETIKHIFNIKGASFILAADREHLENSAKTAFGPDLIFNEYYRRFVHREVTLPEVMASQYAKIAESYVQKYISVNKVRVCCVDFDVDQRENLIAFIVKHQLTFRQLQEAFRIIGHLFERSDLKNEKLRQLIAISTMVMAVLKVGNSDLYKKLGVVGMKASDLYSYVQTFGARSVEWWFKFFITGGALGKIDYNEKQKILEEYGFLKNGDRGDFTMWTQNWGNSDYRLSETYNKIEQLYRWL